MSLTDVILPLCYDPQTQRTVNELLPVDLALI